MSETLYHYTSAQGLLGIVGRRTIWATESNFMNDPGEVSYARDVITRKLREAEASDPSTVVDRRIYEALNGFGSGSSAHIREDRTFITSFSKQDDHLTLWRSYAGKHGFAVGFDAEHLTSWIGTGAYTGQDHLSASIVMRERQEAENHNFGLSCRMADVVYGETGTDPIAKAILALLPEIAASTSEPSFTIRGALTGLVEIKHPAFVDEREVRLIARETGDHAPRRKIRVSPTHGLVAYHEIVFPHSAIKSITIAPGANAAQARSAISSLLQDGGRGAWDHVEIRTCDIPFVW